jgi:cyanophycin synthetase
VIQGELRAGRLADLAPAGDLLAHVGRALPSLGAPAADSWGELALHVALELQRLAGAPALGGRVVADPASSGRWTVIMGYDEEELGEESLHEAAGVLRDCLRGDDPEIERTVAELSRLYRRSRPDAATRAMIDAARRRGIPVRRTPGEPVVQLGLGVAQRRISGTTTERTSALAAALVADASRTARALERVGIDPPVESDAEPGKGRDYRVVVVNGCLVAAAELRAAAGGVRAIDCTDAIHPQNRALCEAVAGAIGLDVAALRVRSPDLAVPLRENGGTVVAVDASPDVAMHLHPDAGTSRDVPGAILDMLYPPGAPTTIPVIAVTGTNGKTTTTRLIAHLFRDTGLGVGFTTTDGVYVGEELLVQGDLTGPFAANVILSHRRVEVAVLETARGGILKSGLGFERCDVAVVTNVTPDHLGLRGIDTVQQLADVKAVLLSALGRTGCAVLNADDPLVLAMRERTAARIALFTMQPPGESAAVEEHLARGGIVARVEQDDATPVLVIRDAARRVVLGAVRDVPLTFGGAARFQVANVLAAAAAAYAQGLPVDAIRAGLTCFVPSAASTPGRLNVFETTRGRVMIDYAHNAAAVEGLVEFMLATPATRRIALLSAPGDRRDEDLREIGRLAARLDLVIPKEHEVYRRGREPGAINALIAEGLREAGFPADRIVPFVEEHDAVAHLLGIMRPGDVAVIVADDTASVTAQIEPYLVAPR